MKYVNGAWKKDVHEGFVDNVDNINIVKKGAIYPDDVDSMKGMKDHPYFHGKGNYLASTQYLFALAKKYINSKEKNEENIKITTKEVFGKYNPLKQVKKGSKKDIAGNVKRILPELWKQYKNEHININTNRKKGYALLGVAIHNATDAMSHSACINLGQYGGWQRVVHEKSRLPKKKQNNCADHWFTTWAEKAQEPLKTVADQWKRLSIADNTTALKAFLEVSGDISKYLIQYVKENEEQCYGCFALPINQYWKGKPDRDLRLADLNENWGAVTSSVKGNFGVSVKVAEMEIKKIEANDVKIYSIRNEIRLKIKKIKPNIYYRVSCESKNRKYLNAVGTGKDAYWILPAKTNKFNVQTCSIKGSKKGKGIKVACSVKFSKKGMKKVKGSVKKINVVPGQTITLPKKGYKKDKYKLVNWCQMINGRPVLYDLGGKYTCYEKKNITLLPLFKEVKSNDKSKKKGSKKKGSKKGKSVKKKK